MVRGYRKPSVVFRPSRRVWEQRLKVGVVNQRVVPAASNWRAAAMRLAALALVGAAAWMAVEMYQYAVTDPRFLVKHIEVKGTSRVGAEEVLRCSGLHLGLNIFQMPLTAAEDRLRRKGWFSRVQVSRRLPDGVLIVVAEREPLITIHQVQVDFEGMVSPKVVQAPPGGLPVPLWGRDEAALEIGRVTHDPGVRVALEVARAIKQRGDLLVKRLEVDDTLNPRLILMNDIQVKLGSQRFEEKLERIHEVLAAVESRKQRPRIIDLRYRDEAAVTFQ